MTLHSWCLSVGFVLAACAPGFVGSQEIVVYQSPDAAHVPPDSGLVPPVTDPVGGDAGIVAPMNDEPQPPAEPCDGRDNDGDGSVDNGCACNVGDVQPCYPGAGEPPAGCQVGVQQCVASGEFGRWGTCDGATIPAEGAAVCCEAAQDPASSHDVLAAFTVMYNADSIPRQWPQVQGFMPEANGHQLTNHGVNVGNEFIDRDRGGVTRANIIAGRDSVRSSAVMANAIEDGDILSSSEPEPVLVGSGCGGSGFALGSIIYRTDAGAIHELVYAYLGICNSGDAEGFYYSVTPQELCAAGSI